MRTLVSQLVTQEPRVLPILLRRHERLSAKGAFEWTWESLSVVLEEMLDATPLTSRISIIVDAMDQCEKNAREIVLHWLKALVDENSPSNCRPPKAALRVMVISRLEPDIHDRLYDFPTLMITDVDTRDDIETLIDHRVKDFARHRKLNPDVRDNIIQYLEENAKGMFLWVVLIMEELENRDQRLTDEAILFKLSRTPLTLTKTYEEILRNIPPKRREDTWRILRWLLFGYRNLTLADLETALCVETGASSWHGFAEDVKFLCGPFIRIDGPQEEINFVHQTARDFLEKHTQNSDGGETAGIAMNTNAANDHLAAICVQYLLSDRITAELRLLLPLNANVHSMLELLRRRPFLRYAAESWGYHTRRAGKPSCGLQSQIRRLLGSPKDDMDIMTLEFFVNKHRAWAWGPTHAPLHVAAYFNLTWLLNSYIVQESMSVNVEAEAGDTPLIWASEMGSTECVKKLLEAGANPNKCEYDGWSALHWAARNGHKDVVILLLEYGANANQKDSKGHTPLDWARDRGFLDIIAVIWSHVEKTETERQNRVVLEEYRKEQEMKKRVRLNAWKLWDFRP